MTEHTPEMHHRIDKMREKNNRLTAAAPTMLTALRMILEATPDGLALEYCKGLARVAIYKATGERQ